MTSSPLIERLEAVEAFEIVHAGEASPRKYRKPINPDGPEAVALIREYEAVNNLALDIRWKELAEGADFTTIDRMMLRDLRDRALRAKATSND